MKTKSKSKLTPKPPNEFEKFKEFTRQLVSIPKDKIDQQEKKSLEKKEKAKR